MGDLIDREKALGCFWAYEDGDETEMPAYDRLQALPSIEYDDDCISRQAAIDEIANQSTMSPHDRVIAVDTLVALPSAQPEIVRCKYCIHRPTLDTVLDMDMYVRGIVEFPDEVCPCQCDISLYSWYPDDDFYCGHAERRQ